MINKETASEMQAPSIYKGQRSTRTVDQGKFVVNFDFPGENLPGHGDHGYGPLSVVAESFLKPGTWIRLHQHSNEDIISYVPAGVMRHADPTAGQLVVDSEHLMVMNSGASFWHEERTHEDDPPLRMLQIFVRPERLNEEPGIQYGPLQPLIAGQWRGLVGPEGAEAPFSVRNEISLQDLYLEEGSSAELPFKRGWETYLYVFEGAIELGGDHLGLAETALITGGEGLRVTARAETLLLAFVINPAARITRQGTIGR